MSLTNLGWLALDLAVAVVIFLHIRDQVSRGKLRLCLIFLVTVTAPPVFAQAPQFTAAGVVNAASYAQPISPGSIVSIFGTNLASAPARAGSTPLPTNLAGTSVMIDGVLAPLFYVSPNQINAQAPSGTAWGPQYPTATVVVTNASGSSDPVQVPINEEALGVFTTDASGCGRGDVFNVAPDGSISLNTPQNSAEPGSFLTIFATGLGGTNLEIPDGDPAPLHPLAKVPFKTITGFLGDFASYYGDGFYVPFAGRAPFEVGVDQFNLQLNLTQELLEGCAVPLRIIGEFSRSQPVPVAIHRGGGQCVDPPPNSYALLRWTRIVTSGLTNSSSESFSAEFPSASWIHLPPLLNLQPPYVQAPVLPPGPSCAWAEPQSDAGTVTVKGPTFGPLVVPKNSSGKYLLSLPAGTIQPGTFTVTSQGANVGAFTTSIAIPAPIQLTTTFVPGVPVGQGGLTIQWRGGDPQSLVDVQVISTSLGRYLEAAVPASDGTVTFGPSGSISNGMGGHNPLFPLTGEVEIVIRQTAAISQVVTFPAQNLTLGGRHLWTYEFHLTGVML
ncbi:MAG TPA: IPT/TIG domain-containing protein [Bryobacteraceae bacterium]|nr:IPT/TIG domain-containing protein [Bryobacteraceae bacterium]